MTKAQGKSRKPPMTDAQWSQKALRRKAKTDAKNGNISAVAHDAPALRDPLYSKSKLYSNGRKARVVSGGAPSLGKRKK